MKFDVVVDITKGKAPVYADGDFHFSLVVFDGFYFALGQLTAKPLLGVVVVLDRDGIDTRARQLHLPHSHLENVHVDARVLAEHLGVYPEGAVALQSFHLQSAEASLEHHRVHFPIEADVIFVHGLRDERVQRPLISTEIRVKPLLAI